MQTQNFKIKVENLIQQRKAGYRADINQIPSNYGTEKETVKEYNGRQLLELLQNADDAQSQQVLIKLDTGQKILTISNKGENCDSFSVEGVKSIMYANLSSKTNNQYIGNKGLGFRSIINWADEISILTEGVKLCFSQEIIKKYYKDLTKSEQRKKIQKERNLLDDEIPMAILAIPEIQKNDGKHWTTAINIQYKEIFLEDIKNQIDTIKAEVLLFLNHLQSIEIDIDGKITTIKNPVNEWTIKNTSGEVPNEHLEENDKNNKYELKIAYNDQLTNNKNNYLFAHFPTKIKVNLPFIVHGTFELDGSRNQLTDNRKNQFIIKKLIAFIIKTALNLKQDEANYQALNFLQYEHKNEVLNGLGFYKEIDTAIEESEIYPCLDNKYRKKADIVYNNDFASFIHDNNFIEDVFYLLKPLDKQELLNKLILYGFDKIDKEVIKSVNLKIKKNLVRVEFIYHLIRNNYENNLPLFTDEKGELINLGDIYEPATQDFLLSPELNYVHIKFINKELFNLIVKRYKNSSKDWKKFTHLKPYNKTEIFRKVITSTNLELEKTDAKLTDLIKSMVSFLYKNYSKSTTISDQKIQLLDKEQKLQEVKNLYLSKTYLSGRLIEELFGSVFNDSDFLADISIYELDDDKQKIEDFFIWLGVNKYTKLVENKITLWESINNGYYQVTANLTSIARFDEIRNLPIENIITWLILDKTIENVENDVPGLYQYYGTKSIPVKNKAPLQLKSLFENHLISSNNKINNLVNGKSIDYSHSLFKSNNVHKADIESLLLNLGAVDDFIGLSFEKIQSVLQSLSERDPQGKLAQKIYLESFKRHKEEKLNNDIDFFAKKGEDIGYFSQDEVYYAGSVKLPKKYTDTLAIFDYPKRNVQDVIDFFGVHDLSKIQLKINKKEISNVNDEFQTYFQEIKPYILTYRIEDLKNKQDEEAKKLNKIKIKLCQNITCQIDKEYTLSDYDYLIDDEDYLIKIPAEKLDFIRQEYDFYTVFGDIFGLVFGLENTDKFKSCIKDSQANIKRDIKEHIGSDAINEAQELLGIASDFYNFWHKIYELKEKTYTKNHNKNLNLINQELGLKIKNSQIKYKDLTDINNAKVIIYIFKKLKIKVLDFNNRQTNKIDLSSYHQQKLEDCFNHNYHQFQQTLHKNCIDNSVEDKYLEQLNKHQPSNINKDFEEALEVNYEEEYRSFILFKFGFKLSNNIENTNIQSIHNNNKQNFNRQDFPDNIESLLYFEDTKERIENYINKENKENKDNSKEAIKEETVLPFVVKSLAPRLDNANDDKPISGRHNPNKDKKNKEKGDKSEQLAFTSLVKKYGCNNVIRESKINDAAGYDIKYKDEGGHWIYVEVKTNSNGVFYLSNNEKNFADKHQKNYELYLVSSREITIIKPVDFSKLKLTATKFKVSYQFVID